MLISALTALSKTMKKKESFTDEDVKDVTPGMIALYVMVWLVEFMISVFALFLCFRRNAGFVLGPFLVACCCPFCYIVYHFAVPMA
ncbi:hypothetical protein TetV_278 [Tetraselmis virus 1]|uniref:Uncharacterized protein n=1 Tax=Tetraselmis virus 1 TaxID=2060617 RepID=A0A2P0VNB8_9VIRU|nr:hypothetical protein QJ968_gp278 [Tetraselmis virus 1]AUF82370.1 hypothetical protein TetV_278 [Tetraselmis virus 1]